ncbi:hypothetical protein N0V88_008004 [Collariella sp. IMI 366227]|nr:hypothetical protein N0V88_008004 [Collariella sp. IMI 366227]
MPPRERNLSPNPEPDVGSCEDLTKVLLRHSKRTERLLKKLQKKENATKLFQGRGLLDLPFELLMAILALSPPSDIFALRQVCKPLAAFIYEQEVAIAESILALRYPIIGQCFPRPVPIQDVDADIRPLLSTSGRPDIRLSFRGGYQSIPPANNAAACTCLTCLLRWNALCAVVDFAYWQNHLDEGEPIPTVDRGTTAPWNEELLARNSGIVSRSLSGPLSNLWLARIFEMHLSSIVRSIRRHSQNSADRRPHFQLTREDAHSGTDRFLALKGPPTTEFPFSRETYYMLEVYLPGRSWTEQQQKWLYMTGGLEGHAMDVDLVVRMARTLAPMQGHAQTTECVDGTKTATTSSQQPMQGLAAPGQISVVDLTAFGTSRIDPASLSTQLFHPKTFFDASESAEPTPRIVKMQDLYQHYGNQSLWDKYDVPKCAVIEVTEVWVEDAEDDSLSHSLVESKTVSSADIDNWLEEPARRCFPGGAYVRSLRLVWVGEDREQRRVSPSTKTLEQLTEAWKLDDGLSYTRSCFAGVSATALIDDSQVYTVAYHPKLAAAWSYGESSSGSTAQMHGIIFAEGEERAELRRILSSKWCSLSASHAMFPALLCSLMLAQNLDSTLSDIKAAVREVEARTGHHRFASRRQTQPAAGELGHLSAQMSGCAAKLANGTRKLKVVETINDFISQHASPKPRKAKTWNHSHYNIDKGEATAAPVGPFPGSHIDLLRHRVQMQAVDTAYVQQRVQIQIAALFHLIAQQDNAIAFDTAKATRSIAASSLQDSSSMKMLALVAMFFLPGSFVAALFSTPLFAWDEAVASGGITVDTRPQFALFWAVTAPLTAAVFLLYGLWMCIQSRRERNKSHSVMSV